MPKHKESYLDLAVIVPGVSDVPITKAWYLTVLYLYLSEVLCKVTLGMALRVISDQGHRAIYRQAAER